MKDKRERDYQYSTKYLDNGSYTQNRPLSRPQYASFRGVNKPARKRDLV